MYSLVSILFLLLLSLSLVVALDPTTLQVDIVFPRPGVDYIPTTPFPVVFFLHNFDQEWAQTARLAWSLSALVQPGEQRSLIRQWTRSEESLTERDVATGLNPRNGISVPDFLLIEQTEGLGHDSIDSRTVFLLDWAIYLDSCATMGNSTVDEPVISASQVFFIDPENGQVPDVQVEGPCPDILATLTFMGNGVLESNGEGDSQTCNLINTSFEGEECASEITNATAQNVIDAMVRAGGCESGGTWPNGNKGEVVCEDTTTISSSSNDTANNTSDDGVDTEKTTGSGERVCLSRNGLVFITISSILGASIF